MNTRTEVLMSTYKPQLSIVVYRSSAGTENYYLESHHINDEGQVMAGKPLLQDTIQQVVDVFFDDRKNAIKVAGFIPENVLSFDPLPGGRYKMIWYRPEEIRFIHFASQLKIKSGMAWIPPMIYVVDRDGLDVFALQGQGRPKINSKLFRAPFHNVSDIGSVCLGNAKVKKPIERTYESLMKYWEALFWLSEFSHLNGASNPTKSDLGKIWKRIVAKKPRIKWSDMDELKPYKNYTLNALIK